MNQLDEPTINNEEVFETVAKKRPYKNDFCKACQNKINCEMCKHGTRGKLLSLKDNVFERYRFYLQNKNSLELIKPINILTLNEAKLMKESYKSSKVFQDIKKQLFNNIPEKRRGICPFCMISEPNTLDHYFSENDYPEYIIFAPNLVPCCSYCNTNKGTKLFIDNKRTIIHFYYDELPQEHYLKAKFWIEDKIPQISFSLDFKNKTEVTDIITKHFDTLHLVARYNDLACGEIATVCCEIKGSLISGLSLDQCMQCLEIRAQAFEKTYGANYWKACIYRAVSENREELIKLNE